MSRLWIIAGELSGDTHGTGLLAALREFQPGLEFSGLGGPKMRAVGGEGITDWVETAGVVGLWEVLKMYGYFKQRLEATVSGILKEAPEGVVLVDYPGFNLRVAKAIREGGYRGKVIYYISPQVWAWKKGRVKTMARVLDLVICIFPFEKPFYEASGLRAEFGGHPMVDRTAELGRFGEREEGLIGWFPGSRKNEVKRLFPVMLAAAKRIGERMPNARFAVSAANEPLAVLMRELAEQAGMPEAVEWIETGTVYDLMQRVEVGAVASGTATLEAACLGLPYALVYQVNWLTYVVGKSVVKIKHLGMVNILAGKEVVKELVQQELTAENLAVEMVRLASDGVAQGKLKEDLAAVVASLGEPGAYRHAAEWVLRELGHPVEG
jgi:lipid-A-disaccharide synthase